MNEIRWCSDYTADRSFSIGSIACATQLHVQPLRTPIFRKIACPDFRASAEVVAAVTRATIRALRTFAGFAHASATHEILLLAVTLLCFGFWRTGGKCSGRIDSLS